MDMSLDDQAASPKSPVIASLEVEPDIRLTIEAGFQLVLDTTPPSGEPPGTIFNRGTISLASEVLQGGTTTLRFHGGDLALDGTDTIEFGGPSSPPDSEDVIKSACCTLVNNNTIVGTGRVETVLVATCSYCFSLFLRVPPSPPNRTATMPNDATQKRGLTRV